MTYPRCHVNVELKRAERNVNEDKSVIFSAFQPALSLEEEVIFSSDCRWRILGEANKD